MIRELSDPRGGSDLTRVVGETHSHSQSLAKFILSDPSKSYLILSKSYLIRSESYLITII